jgi:hypothetical protein
LVRFDFLTTNSTAHKVMTAAAATTKMSVALPNSGTLGVDDVDVVGLDDEDVLGESDMTEMVLSARLDTKISPLTES